MAAHSSGVVYIKWYSATRKEHVGTTLPVLCDMSSNRFYYYLSQAGRAGGSEPVIPLPEVGAGGPVYPGNNTPAQPVIPLPYPGEGGPVYPGGGSITQPCTSTTRFLNAAYGYPSLRIRVGNSRFVNRLGYAAITGYGRVRSGYQTVTVTGNNGRVYIQRSMPFQANDLTTTAIIRTASGLDLLQIPDICCPSSGRTASFRVGNLAFNSSPLDVLMSDGRVVFGDLRYKEVASFRRIQPGAYRFFYADTDMSPMASSLSIESLDPAWLDIHPPPGDLRLGLPEHLPRRKLHSLPAPKREWTQQHPKHDLDRRLRPPTERDAWCVSLFLVIRSVL